MLRKITSNDQVITLLNHKNVKSGTKAEFVMICFQIKKQKHPNFANFESKINY